MVHGRKYQDYALKVRHFQGIKRTFAFGWIIVGYLVPCKFLDLSNHDDSAIFPLVQSMNSQHALCECLSIAIEPNTFTPNLHLKYRTGS